MLTAGMSPAVSAQALETACRRECAALDGSVFDLRSKLMPDAVSLIGAFGFLTERERRLVGHIKGRTYVNMFAALERAVADEFDAWRTGDAIDSPSEINISARARRRTFQRMDRLLARSMPAGYRSVVDLDSMTRGAARWDVAALGLAVELFKQAHFEACDDSDTKLSPMFRNAFLREQAGVTMQAMIAEIEWILRNADLTDDSRDAAVDGFTELIEKLDRTLHMQAALDTRYFAMYAARALDRETLGALEAGFRKAYRGQYLTAGVTHPRFAEVLNSLVTDGQAARINRALESLR